MKQYIVLIPSGFDNAKEVVEFTNNSQYQSIDEALVNIITNLTSEEVVEGDVLTFTLEEFISQVNDGAIDNLTNDFIAKVTIFETEYTEVEQAKAFLKSKGYYVDNLFEIGSVQHKYECTDEQAYECLDATFHSEWFTGEIRVAMETIADCMLLVEKDVVDESEEE
jgi:hypothetical protein